MIICITLVECVNGNHADIFAMHAILLDEIVLIRHSATNWICRCLYRKLCLYDNNRCGSSILFYFNISALLCCYLLACIIRQKAEYNFLHAQVIINEFSDHFGVHTVHLLDIQNHTIRTVFIWALVPSTNWLLLANTYQESVCDDRGAAKPWATCRTTHWVRSSQRMLRKIAGPKSEAHNFPFNCQVAGCVTPMPPTFECRHACACVVILIGIYSNSCVANLTIACH